MAGPIRISILADDRASRVFGSVGASAGGMSARVGKYGKAMGLAVAGGAIVAGAATVKWASDSVSSLARIERINAQTAAVIKSTGGAANVTAKHVENLSGRLEDLTATEAETTQENANLLATFTNVQNQAGKGNKIFDRTVRTFVDMQRAIPSASMTSLGKALNDPVKGISALTRVGVSFTDQQKDQIENLVKHNKTMEAQKVILGELTKEFGGSGKAFAKTAEGQKALLGHAFGTLGETIFAPLLPWLTKATAQTTVFVNYLNENAGPALTKVQGYIAPVVDVLGQFFNTSSSGNSMLATSIGGVVAAYTGFYSAVWPIILALSDGIREQWGSIGPDVEHIWTSVQNSVQSALSIVTSIVKGATALVVGIWDKFGDTLTSFTVTSLKNVISALRGAFEIIEGVFQVVSSALKGDWSGVWDGIQKILSGALKVITASLSQAWNMVSTGASIAWNGLKAVIEKAWDGAVAAVKSGVRRTVETVSSLQGKITGALSGAKDWLVQAGRDIIAGLVSGIDEAAQWVQDKIQALADSIPGWLKKRLGIASPSKVMRRLSKWIPAGIAEGISDGLDGVRKALQSITDLIQKRIDLADNTKEKARERDILASLREQFAALVENGKAQDKVNEALDRTRDRLKEIKQAAADYAAQVKDIIVSSGDITTAAEGVDWHKNPLTGTAIAEGLDDQVLRAQAFAAYIDKLRRAGLNETSLRQLLDKGVEGGFDAAQALARSSAETIAQINTLTAELTETGKKLGLDTADAFYANGIRTAEAVIAGLEARGDRLDKIADRLADRLLDRVLAALPRVANQVKNVAGGKDRQTTAEKVDTAARVIVEQAKSTTTTPVLVDIKVNAPVGASSADIGRELQSHLTAYFTSGGRRLAVG